MTKEELTQIKAELEKHGTTFYVVDEGMSPEWNGEDYDMSISTISSDPKRVGWENDGGYEGYGLPKDLAKFFAQSPSRLAALVKRVEEAEAHLAEAVTLIRGFAALPDGRMAKEWKLLCQDVLKKIRGDK